MPRGWSRCCATAGVTVVSAEGTAPARVRLRRGAVKNPHGFAGAYQLEVTGDGIDITAADADGFIHAAETLRQLITPLAGKPSVPCATIRDWPAFPVRGFMLDTGPQLSVAGAPQGANRGDGPLQTQCLSFPLHRQPRLAAWKARCIPQSRIPASMTRLPGKFYSQAEFRELVEFCRERGITLIPEMDMPGHSEAFRKALGITSMNAPADPRRS